MHSPYSLSLFVCLFSVKSSIIDREPVHRVVTLLLEAEAAVDNDVDDEATGGPSSSSSAIRVVDAFFVPKFRYDPIKKIFYEYVMSPSPLKKILLLFLFKIRGKKKVQLGNVLISNLSFYA